MSGCPVSDKHKKSAKCINKCHPYPMTKMLTSRDHTHTEAKKTKVEYKKG